MPLKSLQILLVLAIAALASTAVAAQDDDRKAHRIKIKDGGILHFEAPKSWGTKPTRKKQDGITHIRFGPFGTQREPIFVVDMTVSLGDEQIDDEGARTMIETELEHYAKVAFESEIPINRLEGSAAVSHYFTLSDAEKKPYEYQYLTLALVYSGKLVVSVYFLSNDGAPDYGADAMHLLTNLRYEPEQEKKRRK